MSTSEVQKCKRECRRLASERAKLEGIILGVREVIDACLVELHLGPNRRGPYPYLSRKIDGKTHLTYVKAKDLPRVRRLTDRWRVFSQSMAEWVKVNRRLESALRRLGKLHVVEFRSARDPQAGQSKTHASRKKR